jgi:hypothetical protein
MTQMAIDISKLDRFTRGYMEAICFTEFHCDNEELEHATFDDFADKTINQIITDCAEFQRLVNEEKDSFDRSLLDLAYDYCVSNYDEPYAGHDFWMTRNLHGVGFWDRGLGSVGNKLTRIAQTFKECHVYKGDDGKVYID